MRIASKRFLILVFILFILVLLNLNKNMNKSLTLWRPIILFSCVVYILLLGISLLSERLNFILFFVYGYFIYLLIPKKYYTVLYFFIFLYMLFFMCEKSNLVVDTSLFWQRYPMASFKALYFLEML